jgi:hypothetical protein
MTVDIPLRGYSRNIEEAVWFFSALRVSTIRVPLFTTGS